MTDSQRTFEQRALRNVRALFERLEGDDRRERKRQWYLVLCAIIPAPLFFGLLGIYGHMTNRAPPESPAHGVRTQCELSVWNTKAADFERKTRAANPSLSAQDIQKRLERERPFLIAEARVECNE
jgi:hypothetical protein